MGGDNIPRSTVGPEVLSLMVAIVGTIIGIAIGAIFVTAILAATVGF